MTIDRSIEEPCEVTSLTHGFEAERRGRPLRLGSALYERLKSGGLPIETSTGGRTKWNRTQRGIPKAHWLDAANVGQSTPPRLLWQHVRPLLIRAMGQQSRQMCRMDAHGFPRTKAKKPGAKHAFRTGDIVRAVVPAHLKNKGVHV
jgi:hypothetical protein